jgi:hypothetical protein
MDGLDTSGKPIESKTGTVAPERPQKRKWIESPTGKRLAQKHRRRQNQSKTVREGEESGEEAPATEDRETEENGEEAPAMEEAARAKADLKEKLKKAIRERRAKKELRGKL